MSVLKVYIRSFVKLNDEFNAALDQCKKRLERYFYYSLKHPNNKIFGSCEVTVPPNSGMIMAGNMDLIVYIVANSKNQLISGTSSAAAGATLEFPDGMYSEVYAGVPMAEGKILFGLLGSNSKEQGVAMANIAFHELAHNKWHGMPKEEVEEYAKIYPNFTHPQNNIHGVGGVMSGQLSAEGFGTLDITDHNARVMAALLQHPIKQSSYLAQAVAHEQYSRR